MNPQSLRRHTRRFGKGDLKRHSLGYLKDPHFLAAAVIIMSWDTNLLIGGRRLPPRPPTPPEITKNYIDLERFCFLCRTALPWSASPDLYPLRCGHDYSGWETDVIALFELNTNDPKPTVHAYKTNLSERNFFTGGPLALRNGKGETQYVYYILSGAVHGASARVSDYPSVMAHVSCWKLVRKLHPDTTFTKLYKLALRLLPILPRKARGETKPFDAVSFLQPEQNQSESDELISRCSRLPPELQRNILNQLPPCIVRSMLTTFYVAQTFVPLLTAEPKLGAEVFTIPRTGYAESAVVKFRASTVNILGFHYLRDLHVTEEDGVEESTAHCIPVKIAEIRSARFVLGVHGISAIRFGYGDGSSSPWLGEMSEGLHGIVRGDATTPLSVMHDGIKVIRLGFERLSSERTSVWPNRAIWDTNPELLEDCELQLITFDRNAVHLSRYPGWRICRYLSLEDGPEYATGLTVYVAKTSILGIAVHGKIPRKFGDCSENKYAQSTPQHFALQPGERIRSLWVHTLIHHQAAFTNPLLFVVTDRDRSAFLGPQREIHSTWAEWTRITPDNMGVVRGLFFDVHCEGIFGLNTYGVAVTYPKSNPGPGDQLAQPEVLTTATASAFLREHDKGLVTIASLGNISTIHLRTVGDRCKAMYIKYSDEASVALGRWDPTVTEGIVELYDYVKHGQLQSIGFSYEGASSTRSWVTNIVFNKTEVGGTFHTLLEVKADKFLAWEYTYDFDNVREWDYETMPIPKNRSRWESKTMTV
ncbi:hypothetical protein HJFPF1_00341 [Paramyrothecium foliicola]|nr:hypothetical protein HJFPF1_00341 [Paramyrothecium foliicola]